MAIGLEDKKAIVAEVNEVAGGALSAVLADYHGVDANDMTELRAKARSEGVYLRIVRNTLARKAVEGTEFECMQEAFVGPTILAFSLEDPGAAARVINDFSKDNEKMVVKLVSIGGKLLEPGEISTLAKLPTYDQAISLLMAVMKAPVEKLARTLNEVPGKLVRTAAAIKDAKEAA